MKKLNYIILIILNIINACVTTLLISLVRDLTGKVDQLETTTNHVQVVIKSPALYSGVTSGITDNLWNTVLYQDYTVGQIAVAVGVTLVTLLVAATIVNHFAAINNAVDATPTTVTTISIPTSNQVGRTFWDVVMRILEDWVKK